MESAKIKVLIADDDGGSALRIKHFLDDNGFETSIVHSGAALRAAIFDFQPRFVLMDLVLPELSALTLLDEIREHRHQDWRHVQVIIMSRHNAELNVQQAIARGATDWINKPFQYDELLRRLIFHSRSLRVLKDPTRKQVIVMDEANLMLHMTQLLLRETLSDHTLEHKLLNLTKMLNMKVQGVRCSVVQTLSEDKGVVAISHDDPKASGIELDLNNYPEIRHVMRTHQLVVVENIDASEELKSILANLQDIRFNTLVTAPVTRHGQPFGVLSVRLPPEKPRLGDEEVRFVDIFAQVTSLLLSAEPTPAEGDFWLERRRSSQPQVLAFQKK
jgi:DNA-binding response OmpR family regulator